MKGILQVGCQRGHHDERRQQRSLSESFSPPALLALLLWSLLAACSDADCEDHCAGAYVVSCVEDAMGAVRERSTDCRARFTSNSSVLNDRFACAMVGGRPTCVLNGGPTPLCTSGAESACDGTHLLTCDRGYATGVFDCTAETEPLAGDRGALSAEVRSRFSCAVATDGKAFCAYEGEPLPECSGVKDGTNACFGEEAMISCYQGLAIQVSPCSTTKYPCKSGQCPQTEGFFFCKTDADCRSISATFTKCEPFVLGSLTTSFSLCAMGDGQ